MTEIAQQLLPVGTLILGWGLNTLNSRFNARGTARREAFDTLAERQRHMWTVGQDDAWQELQIYLGKLRARLRYAGVPAALVSRLEDELTAFWRSVYDPGQNVGLIADHGRGEKLDETVRQVEIWLDPAWRPVARHKALADLEAATRLAK